MLSMETAGALGVIQGITEFLPVSSSGHLVITQHLFGLTQPVLFFDIVLHFGTLTAIVWYYRSELSRLLLQTKQSFTAIIKSGGLTKEMSKSEGLRLFYFVILGSVPTGLMAISFKDNFESLFTNPSMVGIMLVVTGIILFLTFFTREKRHGLLQMTAVDSLIIGVVQGFAIAPGISRSGVTIVAALLLGLDREMSAKYSFILSIPAILGAMLLNIGAIGDSETLSTLSIGFFAALVTGYISLAVLVSFVLKGRLAWFSFYCIATGTIVYFFI
ncbi:MAG TPA: undecaprenyl-diphosphate phosphatase [Nitrospinota bacterium]|jgi:undecaprenyl-diphosphatase|nr:undecaprenyl-diphosphate phosphatase [Nitrospinota bacterium]|tara:strand:+ start:38198 stop:39016 length:819 start_codon:yes stop_codon:yes gene_type:complete